MKHQLSGVEPVNIQPHLGKAGSVHGLRYLLWRLGLVLTKNYMRFQDWTGLYGYRQWSRFYTLNAENEPGAAAGVFFSQVVKANAARPELLKETCASLVQQSHRNWEAFLILDQPITTEDLPKNIQDEPRFHWLIQPAPPVWKQPLMVSKGDWIAYLNGGDTLPVTALAQIARTITDHPISTIFYSDMDNVSLYGNKYFDPSFWPDWSPDLLLSVNYLRPAYVRRIDLVQAAEVSDDFEDALLRCVEHAEHIHHIPQVLYHQRGMQDEPWVDETFSAKSLEAHLDRSGLKNVRSQTSHVSCSQQFTWSFDQPLVSIIILTRDNAELLKRCLDSISKYTGYPQYEILLVENNSREKATFDYYRELQSNPRIKVLAHNLPFNYSAFNNWAARQSAGKLLLFLNNDIECFEPEWLEELARWSCRQEIGVVGAKLLYKAGAIQHAGLVVGLEGHANHIFSGKNEGFCGPFGTDEWYRDYSAVTGACMMLRHEVFDHLGGFDEGYSLAFNDIELCQRTIQAGYRVVYTPFSRLYHQEGATRSRTKPVGDIRLAYQHLKPLIERGDPYYNPNLSTALRVPTLRRPWEQPAIQRLDQILEFEG